MQISLFNDKFCSEEISIETEDKEHAMLSSSTAL